MIEKTRFWHIARYAVPAVVIFWILIRVAFHEKSRFAELFGQHRNEKTIFVDDFLLLEVDGEFDGSAIETLCNNKTWTPGIVLTCEAVPGGLADVKNGILSCIRTAIEMGSSAGVVLPGIVRRSHVDMSVIVPGDVGPRRGVSLGHFFDLGHLNSSLATYCPQMAVYESMNSFFDKPSMLEATKLNIYKLPGVETLKTLHDRNTRVLAHPELLGQQIRTFLNRKSPPGERRYPYHVHLVPTPQNAFPAATTESAALYANFGRLLRVRNDLRRLAAAALFNLHTAFALRLDLHSGIRADAFAAVELRTEKDATKAAFPSYTVQASDALSYLTNNNMSVAFLGTGATVANTTAFVKRAAEFDINVVTKEDLVEGMDASLLGSLSWDQLGLVDYELMMHAGLFTGTARSSFAWNLALRRQHAFGTPGPANSSHLDGHIRWHDRFSTLYGNGGIGDAFEQTIWP
ncbi:hypothetical protein CMQ_3717 [Grosmannia clavigera kw1407]|uniref:Alternative oxidase n=1 Tax=Grosmannia clavigera (strain kw1407 / UAMH 11150) TaxID=655863 RepID=F0X9F3_GROCL|nr:uncharacterized protein CMQ_3717 [Grosmannia clavigera kw1407]EFX05648.1 hypothetical protein CMQ_3717 [Grosmannia clavigera kw1407]